MQAEKVKIYHVTKSKESLESIKEIGCSVYNAEVIIETKCIPPEKLIFLNDKICQYPSSTPVVNKNN